MNITRKQIDELRRWILVHGTDDSNAPSFENLGVIVGLIAEWEARQQPVIDQRVCKYCGKPKGQHGVPDLNCPRPQGGFFLHGFFDPVEP